MQLSYGECKRVTSSPSCCQAPPLWLWVTAPGGTVPERWVLNTELRATESQGPGLCQLPCWYPSVGCQHCRWVGGCTCKTGALNVCMCTCVFMPAFVLCVCIWGRVCVYVWANNQRQHDQGSSGCLLLIMLFVFFSPFLSNEWGFLLIIHRMCVSCGPSPARRSALYVAIFSFYWLWADKRGMFGSYSAAVNGSCFMSAITND